MKINNYIKYKNVLITGASKGIGYESAKLLAQYGCKLYLTARNLELLNNVKNELSNITQIEVIKLDVTNKDEVNAKLKNLDIDILLNNAGLSIGLDRFNDANIDEWETVIDTNIKGLLYVTKAVINNMMKKDSAHIVNIGSVSGIYAYPKGNVYCATKSAVHSITEGLNSDLLGTNVKVTTVAPGATETNFSDVRFRGDKEKAKEVYKGFDPLKPEDIAYCIVTALNTPKHVNIQHIDVMPTAQRNPYLLSRE